MEMVEKFDSFSELSFDELETVDGGMPPWVIGLATVWVVYHLGYAVGQGVGYADKYWFQGMCKMICDENVFLEIQDDDLGVINGGAWPIVFGALGLGALLALGYWNGYHSAYYGQLILSALGKVRL